MFGALSYRNCKRNPCAWPDIAVRLSGRRGRLSLLGPVSRAISFTTSRGTRRRASAPTPATHAHMQCTCSRQIVAARTCRVPAASAAGKGSGLKPHARRKRSTRTKGEPALANAHETTREGALRCPPPIPAAAAVPSAHEVERAALADQPVHARRLAVGVERRLCAAVRLDHELCEGLRRGLRRRGRRQVEPRGVAVERLGAQLVLAGLVSGGVGEWVGPVSTGTEGAGRAGDGAREARRGRRVRRRVGWRCEGVVGRGEAVGSAAWPSRLSLRQEGDEPRDGAWQQRETLPRHFL